MKEINFKITENSLNKTNEIINNMNGKSFHNHYHILYDICDSFEGGVTYVEIGTFAGGSASLISTHPKVNKVISIDLGMPINKSIPINNVTKFKHNDCVYDYIEGDSTNPSTIERLRKLTTNVDVLFIDGDHQYDGVIKDFNNYKDFVVKGGYIIFDDYQDYIHSPEVKKAVDDLVGGLNVLEYEILGSIEYDLISKTNVPELSSSNEFILKKLY
jgi:predicted O-methyltransferase YrrM